MWAYSTLILLCICAHTSSDNTTSGESDNFVLYYYGLEESERGLPLCGARAACSARLARWWTQPALVRLCRCARRRRCDDALATPDPHSRIDINSRAYFQFCKPVISWATCKYGETALTVETSYDRLNPDELEHMHHNNIQLVPPKVLFNCRCPEPNYWRLNTSADSDYIQSYQCSSLPPCKSGEYCGNVNNDFYALYQSCLCPKHHICVHNGGLPRHQISELLYRGVGWKAYCQRIGDYSYEDYYQ